MGIEERADKTDKIPYHIQLCIDQSGVLYALMMDNSYYCPREEYCPHKVPSPEFGRVPYCGKQEKMLRRKLREKDE